MPIAYGPMLSVTEPDTQVITIVSATQTLKSEFLINVAGYFIHQDPASMLFVQPTQKLAENFSKERFEPTREATECLRALIEDPRSRDSGNTIVHKEFPSGTLDFVGANSPVDLASRPKRITLADEVDLYPADAGGMGDPLALAEERSSTFRKRRKNIRVCSPSSEQTSRIWREYLASDKRRCFVECAECGHEQILRWSRDTVIWDKDEAGNHLPETVKYHCECCGVGWSESQRLDVLRALEFKPDHGWRQTRAFRCCNADQEPSVWNGSGRALCNSCGNPAPYDGHAGFHISKLYSTRHDLADVVREYLGAYKNSEKMRKFTNTALAEVWKEQTHRIDPRGLRERCEPYSFDAAPEAVKLVVAGVDTQDDRIEVTFVGFGADEEIWVLRHEVLLGDTAKIVVWNHLDELLKERAVTVDGRALAVDAACIDTGGHRGAIVHAFCRARKGRRVYPVKGAANDAGSRLIWPKTPTRTRNAGDRLYVVGVDTAKDLLASSLAIVPADDGGPTPRAIHFPHIGLSEDYFTQLTAEHAVTLFVDNRPRRRWVPKEQGARNEALDCFVYAIAARLSLPNKLRSVVMPKPVASKSPPPAIKAESSGLPVEFDTPPPTARNDLALRRALWARR